MIVYAQSNRRTMIRLARGAASGVNRCCSCFKSLCQRIETVSCHWPAKQVIIARCYV